MEIISMRISLFLTFSLVIISMLPGYSQNNYWTESFENTVIPGNTTGLNATTPQTYTLTSGTWTMYYLYRGSTGVCATGKPLRFLNNTTAGLNGPTYAITPSFTNGVGQLFFVENSAAPRTVTIYKSYDGTSFSLLQAVVTAGSATRLCDTSLLTINDPLIVKLKFTNETSSNLGIDNMIVTKSGTLLDGTTGGGGGGGGVAGPPYYPDVIGRLPAFPGAEGAGGYTRGGRGGVIVEVTNLLDDVNGNIVGSFRWAQKQNVGPKTIVFRVSGTIHLAGPLSFQRGDMTIAGQTAPGDGICIADFPITIGKANIIMRFIRFRLGDIGITRTSYASSSGDAVNSSGGLNCDSMIIDHCTASWSIDEAATFKNMTHFTMQNCMISEPLNESDHSGELHGYGGIWGGVNASFHHNLFAHCSSRNCRFNGSRQYTGTEKDTIDYRNNVIYNWGINTVYGGEGGYYNIVNNYYKPGPSTNVGVIERTWNPYQDGTLAYGKAYMTGNIMHGSPAVTANNWLGVKMEDGLTPLADTGLSKLTSQVTTYRVTSHSAQDAYAYVLQNAGATLPKRDTLDQRIINDVMNGTGRIIDTQGGFPAHTDTTFTTGAWPTLLSRSAPADNDHDGMADEWELQRGLDPTQAADRNGISTVGFTHLENYLNGDSIVAGGIINSCIPVPGISATGTNEWLNLKDSSYLRFISTDTMNLVASIKDQAAYGGFTASYYTTNTNRSYNGSVYLNRNITIVPANPAAITGPVVVRVYFSTAEFNALKAANPAVTQLSDLVIFKISDNACPSAINGAVAVIIPTAFGNYGTYNNGYYLEFSTTSFSTFFIGAAAAVVPVRLLNYKASLSKSTVLNIWKTTDEINTQNFYVERGTTGYTFSSIGSVIAVNTAGDHNYEFTDHAPLKGVSYYRLRMTDRDGRFSYSHIEKIIFNSNDPVAVFPNPVKNVLRVNYPAATEGALIIIYASDGKKVAQVILGSQTTQRDINVAQLIPGVYILHFENNGEVYTLKFEKR